MSVDAQVRVVGAVASVVGLVCLSALVGALATVSYSDTFLGVILMFWTWVGVLLSFVVAVCGVILLVNGDDQ